jgi:hypothetical protein
MRIAMAIRRKGSALQAEDRRMAMGETWPRPHPARSPWLARAALSCVALAMFCGPAWAFRPFQGSDAAVADFGELEVELQPAGVLKQGAAKTLVAPDWVVSLGFAQGWEVSAQGQGRFPLGQSDDRASFAGDAVFLKHMLREGSL